MILVVKKDSTYKSVADIIADAKKRPGEIKYSSSGVYGATHLPTEMFANAAGIKLGHVPYTGGGPALIALLGGHVDILFTVPIIAFVQLKSREVTPLAVASEKRHPAFPNVPTLKELGYDVEYYMWCGFFAPKATPPDILKTLREATRKAAASPEFKAAMDKMNTPSTTGTPTNSRNSGIKMHSGRSRPIAVSAGWSRRTLKEWIVDFPRSWEIRGS